MPRLLRTAIAFVAFMAAASTSSFANEPFVAFGGYYSANAQTAWVVGAAYEILPRLSVQAEYDTEKWAWYLDTDRPHDGAAFFGPATRIGVAYQPGSWPISVSIQSLHGRVETISASQVEARRFDGVAIGVTARVPIVAGLFAWGRATREIYAVGHGRYWFPSATPSRNVFDAGIGVSF